MIRSLAALSLVLAAVTQALADSIAYCDAAYDVNPEQVARSKAEPDCLATRTLGIATTGRAESGWCAGPGTTAPRRRDDRA